MDSLLTSLRELEDKIAQRERLLAGEQERRDALVSEAADALEKAAEELSKAGREMAEQLDERAKLLLPCDPEQHNSHPPHGRCATCVGKPAVSSCSSPQPVLDQRKPILPRRSRGSKRSVASNRSRWRIRVRMPHCGCSALSTTSYSPDSNVTNG
jgi:hypothetical protein